MKLTPYIRNTILALPFYLLTIVPFWLLLSSHLDASVKLSYVLLGALGWWLAFLLRLPIIAATRLLKLSDKTSQNLIVAASGPTEETVRIILIGILGLTTRNALSVGIGWAAIEVLYAIIQGFGMGVLDQKTDPKAMEAKKLIKQQGMEKSMSPSAPFWGVIERLSANGLHISFSLILVASPFFVMLTIPLHSAFNFVALALYKKSALRTQITLALVATVFMIITFVAS